jgi:hypothetical protein
MGPLDVGDERKIYDAGTNRCPEKALSLKEA